MIEKPLLNVNNVQHHICYFVLKITLYEVNSWDIGSEICPQSIKQVNVEWSGISFHAFNSWKTTWDMLVILLNIFVIWLLLTKSPMAFFEMWHTVIWFVHFQASMFLSVSFYLMAAFRCQSVIVCSIRCCFFLNILMKKSSSRLSQH